MSVGYRWLLYIPSIKLGIQEKETKKLTGQVVQLESEH